MIAILSILAAMIVAGLIEDIFYTTRPPWTRAEKIIWSSILIFLFVKHVL